MLQISHSFEVVVCRCAVRSHRPEYLLPQLLNDFRVLAELVEEKAQGPRRGVSTCKQDRNDLIADDFAVSGGIGKGVKEGLVLGVLEC